MEGESPSSSVRLQGAVIETDSFQKLVLMDCLKKVLGDGFQGSLRVCASILTIDVYTMTIDELYIRG